MTRITTRPATAADIADFYGGARRETVQSVMVIKDGKAVGIIGLKREPTRLFLFADGHPELGNDIRSFAVRRAVLQMLRTALRSKLPLFSVRAPDSDVLPRLGFERVSGDLYRWPP